MPSRAELNLRARVVNLDPTTIPNDSKLEQKVLYLEKTAVASGTATVLAVPTANLTANTATVNGVRDTLSGVSGDANV